MIFRTIPDGWEIKKMPQVVKWGSGGTPKATEKQYYDGGSIPWLVIGDLNDSIVSSSASKITELGLQNSSAKMIPAGTLLVAMYGSIGKLGITGIECCTNQAIAYAKELYGVTTKYMFFYMAMMKSELISKGKGGTQKNISQTVLNSLEVIVPPLPEQERIVARIEELFSQLDAGVETLKKTKAEIVLYRQAVFSSVIGKYDGVSKKLSDIAVTVDGDRGKNYPKKAELTQTGDCLFLTAANVKPYGWSFEDNTFISKEKDGILHGGRLQKNDVVITTRGTLGNVAIYDESVPFDTVRINSCMLIIRVTDESVSPYYLAQYLMSPMFKYQIAKLKSGTAQPQIPANILREIPLKIPSSNDQNAIIGELTGKFSVCDSIEQTVDTALQQAEAMRQSILKDAFEGKL